MNISVFLGAKTGNGPACADAARALGTWMGREGHTLVFGASRTGLMGLLSDAVKENGGRLVGVTVEVPMILAACRDDLDERYVLPDMAGRKRLMTERGDVFVVFPGSLGTLEEMADVLSAIKLSLVRKPCFLLNLNGFYDPLEAQIENMCAFGFLSRTEIPGVEFVPTVEELTARLEALASARS